MSKPEQIHFKVVKIILRYVKGTINVGLFYDVNCDFILKGCSDLDLGGDPNYRKSTCGYYFFVGLGEINWNSKKQ